MKPQVVQRPTGVKSFGQALKKVRTERGFSHKEIADRVGVKKDQVRQWEDDLSTPSNFHLKKLYGTFSNLRFFTTLLPTIDRERLINKANDLVATAKLTGELPEYDTFFPPIAGKNEELPEELSHTNKPKTFGEHLRMVRLNAGVDLQELAELMSVTSQACSSWELDKAIPVMDHYVRLRDLFPGLKDAPAPDSADKPKPSGGPGISRNLGNQNGVGTPRNAPTPPLAKGTLRAVPTAFDAIATMPLAEPNPPQPEEEEEEIEVEAPPQVPKTPQDALEFAGVEYARYLAAKQKEEYRVAMLRAQLIEAEKNLADATELVKMSHEKLIDLATKM